MSSWDGYQNDSPSELLDRFRRRFPGANAAELAKFARVVGIGDSVVYEYLRRNNLGKIRPGRRNSDSPFGYQN